MNNKLKIFFNKYKILFLIFIVIGFIAHGYMLTNKLVNHDELISLFSKGGTYEIGRWGLPLISYIFPNISMPWFNGIFSLIFLAISSCLIIDILQIKNKYGRILIGGIFITFPTIIGTFSYMFTSTAYAISILLSVLSVKLFISDNKCNNILGIICMILSTSIYQSYTCIVIVLLMILLLKYCLKDNKSFKEITKLVIKYIIEIIISLTIYFLLTKVINYILGINMSNYQNASDIGIPSIRDIAKGILSAYRTIINIYSSSWNSIVTDSIMKFSYIFCLIASLILFIKLIINNWKKDKKKTILFIFIVILMPIGINILYIITPNSEIHTLMTYGNVTWFIMPIILYEWNHKIKFEKYLKYSIYIIASIVLFNYITFANEAYFKLNLAYENTYSFYTTLVTKIEATDGFSKDTKVLFIGDYSGELLVNNDEHFKSINGITGIINNLSLINAYSKEYFLKNYIGITFNYANESITDQIKNTQEFKEMDIYPYYNSIKKINDIIVVKFSE